MDPVSAARTARESLARGLASLQSPGVPPQLLQAAEPVAHAMSALHRIEATGGAALGEAAPAALVNVRNALGLLQAQPFSHPAIDQALEAIAGSLGIVHQLSQSQVLPPTQPAPQSFANAYGQQGYGAPTHPAPAASPLAGTMLSPQPSHQPVPPAAPSAPYTQPSSHLPFTGRPDPHVPVVAAPQPAAPAPAPVPHSAYGASPAYRGNPDHASTLTSAGNPFVPAAHAPAPAAPAPVAPASSGAQAPQHGGLPRVEAALGAHSTTNFYKGLSGNDIIESGGIFVATYALPRIGTSLVIHVSLPGGYEFDALAVVRWTRDTPQGSDAPPGFGAQFTQISPEHRQLVYRYVRNREPLFHDDL